MHSDSRVRKKPGHVGEVCFGDTDNGLPIGSELRVKEIVNSFDLIDVAQDNLLDGIVPQDFSNDAAVATTYNKDLLGVRVTSERDM